MTRTIDLQSTPDLDRLRTNRETWARLPLGDKIRYLEDVRELTLANAEAWVAAGAEFKGFPADHPSVGAEEWLGGPYPSVAWMSDALHTLGAIRAGADPLADLRIRTTPDGQVVVRVMPGSIYDRLLLSGYCLDVWMEPGITEATVRADTGSFHKLIDPPGQLTLVLGAGNVSAIPVLDVLHAMFVLGEVVVLKLNPVGDAYGPTFAAIFEPLIRDGYLQIVTGGAEVGEQLVRDERVDSVHITGSARTFDAIVWGTGPDAVARKERDEPLLDKPITSELGGVGATIVVPGRWSKADIAYQAQHIATQKLHSSGHTCVASQVLVLPAAWDQRDEFVAAVKDALRSAPARRPFYPGADARRSEFLDLNPEAALLSGGQDVALLQDIDPESDHPAFTQEFFGPIYVTTSLPGSTPEEFLANAVTFANDRLDGNLSANLIVDPHTADKHREALEGAVAALRSGCIGVNAWAGVAFLISRAAWGAYAGNTTNDIKSGSGTVHNSLMLDRPQKNVLWAPFRPFPRSARHAATTIAVKPPWFLENRTSVETARRFTAFAGHPSPAQLPRLFAAALRG